MAVSIGTVLDGKYEILKQIGKGGMSTVYLAMDNRLNKQWAVKEIKKTGVGANNEQIVNKIPPAQDAEMMKRLDHPAIPRIVDIIENIDNEYIYVIMDYVEGVSLDKVVEENGALPQENVIEWAKQICEALGYLHSQKPPIIYRDMKPANVMLKPDGNIKIIDFGIAREFKETNLADTTALGTNGYASPEHHGGRTDPRSDIYTLGMTMHHLVTGVDPRPADYRYVPIRQWNPELSGGLERIIDKCVRPDPKDRYQNCNELLYALDHYTEEEESFKKSQKTKLLSFIICIALCIVFAAAGGITLKEKNVMETQNYDNLVQFDNLDFQKVQENFENAVAIDQSNKTAYENYLNYIISNDSSSSSGTVYKIITDDEIGEFMGRFHEWDTALGEEKSQDYYDIAFKAGKYFFFYYDSDGNPDTETDTSEKALKAIDLFDDCKDNNEVAKHFYTVCEFYKASGGVGEKTGEDYKETINAIKECLDYVNTEYINSGSGENGDGTYIRMSMYKSSMDFINSKIGTIKKMTTEDGGQAVTKDDLKEILVTDIKNNMPDDSEDEFAQKKIDYIRENIDKVITNVENAYGNETEGNS